MKEKEKERAAKIALMTDRQLRLKKRNDEIVAEYKELKHNAKESFKEWSAYRSLAAKFNITSTGVKYILDRAEEN